MQKKLQVHAVTMVELSKLNPAPYNPRKMQPYEFEALKASLRENGFVEPLVVQKRGMAIIGGHQRLCAIKEICIEDSLSMPALPCTVLDVDDRSAKRLNIALNQIKGDFDARLLGELLDDLNDDLAIDSDEALLMGLAQEEIAKHIKLVSPPEPDEGNPPRTFGSSVTLSLEFQDTQKRDRLKKILIERAAVEKKKTGEIVLDMLSVSRKAKVAKKSSRLQT